MNSSTELLNINKIKVFISYAREDYEIAKKIYFDLKNKNINPWIDRIDILGGQNWKLAIKKNLVESQYIIILISSHSVSKKGYVQKEIILALEILDEYPPDAIFIIPVRLDDSEPSHDKLKSLHWVDLFPYEDGIKRILKVLSFKDSIGIDTQKEINHKKITFDLINIDKEQLGDLKKKKEESHTWVKKAEEFREIKNYYEMFKALEKAISLEHEGDVLIKLKYKYIIPYVFNILYGDDSTIALSETIIDNLPENSDLLIYNEIKYFIDKNTKKILPPKLYNNSEKIHILMIMNDECTNWAELIHGIHEDVMEYDIVYNAFDAFTILCKKQYHFLIVDYVMDFNGIDGSLFLSLMRKISYPAIFLDFDYSHSNMKEVNVLREEGRAIDHFNPDILLNLNMNEVIKISKLGLKTIKTES